MAGAHYDLLNCALDTIFGRELTLLDAPFDEDVVALVERQRNCRQIAVKREAVPVRVFLGLSIAVFECVAFAYACIRHRRTGRQIADHRLRSQVSRDFYAIFLHTNLCSFVELKFFNKALLAVCQRLVVHYRFLFADLVARAVKRFLWDRSTILQRHEVLRRR
jgi:hypothetical protein